MDDKRRYKIVSITRMVPVEMFLLVSNIPENPDSPDGLKNEWDIEVLRPVDYCVDPRDMQERVEEFDDDDAQELDIIANDRRRGSIVYPADVQRVRKYGL